MITWHTPPRSVRALSHSRLPVVAIEARLRTRPLLQREQLCRAVRTRFLSGPAAAHDRKPRKLPLAKVLKQTLRAYLSAPLPCPVESTVHESPGKMFWPREEPLLRTVGRKYAGARKQYFRLSPPSASEVAWSAARCATHASSNPRPGWQVTLFCSRSLSSCFCLVMRFVAKTSMKVG